MKNKEKLKEILKEMKRLKSIQLRLYSVQAKRKLLKNE